MAAPCYSVSVNSSRPSSGGGEVKYVPGYDKVKELQRYVFSAQKVAIHGCLAVPFVTTVKMDNLQK